MSPRKRVFVHRECFKPHNDMYPTINELFWCLNLTVVAVAVSHLNPQPLAAVLAC